MTTPDYSRRRLLQLAGSAGLLSGFSRVAQAQQLALVARDLGCSLPQLAIAWCLRNPRVSTVITGASRVVQVAENMKAIEVAARLDDALLARIERIVGPVAG